MGGNVFSPFAANYFERLNGIIFETCQFVETCQNRAIAEKRRPG